MPGVDDLLATRITSCIVLDKTELGTALQFQVVCACSAAPSNILLFCLCLESHGLKKVCMLISLAYNLNPTDSHRTGWIQSRHLHVFLSAQMRSKAVVNRIDGKEVTLMGRSCVR